MTKINRINSINECPPDGRVIIEYCNRQSESNPKIRTRNGHGDHAVVSTDLGGCAVPVRPLGKGLFCKIIKTLISIGISIVIFAVITGYIQI